MGDSDDSTKPETPVPAWQQAASKPPEESKATSPFQLDTLDLAKRFLEDEGVRDSSREEKEEFLKTKGYTEEDIHKLLEEDDQQRKLSKQQQQQTANQPTPDARKQDLLQPSSAPSEPYVQEVKTTDHVPIVTYPEFLTKPAKPPPLITASGLLNSLGLIAGFSTFVYGATKYIVSPMVETLTEARVDFHHNANKNLSQLVDKLEHTVSEIPTTYHHIHKNKPTTTGEGYEKDDDASSYDDPTELFHRDVGVQTSPPPTSPVQQLYNYNNDNNNSSPKLSSTEKIQHQADRLARISLAARNLATEMISQAEDSAETKNVLDKLNGDLHTLTYPPESFGMGSNYMYGTTRNEPDDEIKKAKTNIRIVKGVLLSTRSFPATTR